MTECILKTEYATQPSGEKNTRNGTTELQIPDHAIERFARFLYSRFLADVEQREKSEA